MADGEVVRRQVDRAAVDLAVDERHGRIVDDLLIAVVLHHDHEQVIQTGNALRHRTLAGHGNSRDGGAQDAGQYASQAVHTLVAPN